MHQVLKKLLVIQDRDRRLIQLKAELARIPVEIAARDARLKEETARLDKTRDSLKHVELDRKKLEVEAESKRAQLAKYRAQQSAIKSNTEYQALLKEIAKTEHDIVAIEDAELELMAKAESLQPELKEEQAALKEAMARIEAEKSELKQRSAQIEKEIQSIQNERVSLMGEVDRDILQRYERLIRSKGDYAVVAIRHGNCGGCHLNIQPQVIHNARHGQTLTSCDYCGRILYWEGE
jgi:hypothetical protein